MPSLDLSEAYLEPSFLDTFQVVRRVETISQEGRSVVSTTRINATGVVDAASPNDLQRLGDMQFVDGAISIVTKFKLFDASQQVQNGKNTSYQPDLVFWAGAYYLVRTLENYSRYGIGWVQAICIEQTYVATPPQDGVSNPMFDFSNPVNSENIPCL